MKSWYIGHCDWTSRNILHWVKEVRHRWVHVVCPLMWFSRTANLLYDNRSTISGFWWAGWGQEGTFRGDGKLLHLDWYVDHASVYIRPNSENYTLEICTVFGMWKILPEFKKHFKIKRKQFTGLFGIDLEKSTAKDTPMRQWRNWGTEWVFDDIKEIFLVW